MIKIEILVFLFELKIKRKRKRLIDLQNFDFFFKKNNIYSHLKVTSLKIEGFWFRKHLNN